MKLLEKYTHKEILKSLSWTAEQVALLSLSVFAFVVAFNLFWQTWVTFLTLDSDEMLNPDWAFIATLKAIFALFIGTCGTLWYHIRKQKQIKQNTGKKDDDEIDFS